MTNIISSDILIKEFNLGYKKGYLDALKEIEEMILTFNKNWENELITLNRSEFIKRNLNKLKEKVKE